MHRKVRDPEERCHPNPRKRRFSEPAHHPRRLSEQCANGTEKDLADYYAISGQRVPVRPDFDGFLSGEDIYQIMMGARKEEYGRILAGTEHAEITAW